MRTWLLIFAAGMLSLLLQTTILHLLPFSPVVPDLILVLCVYWGLYNPSVAAVLGSFALGYSVDVLSSPILGLNAFAMSLVFLAVYLSSRSIWLHHPIVSAIVVFFACLVKGLALVVLWALFLSVESFWVGAARYVIIEATIAAVLAPFVFALLRRGQSYLDKLRVAVP
jgi:rod shape-determining protein MreD